MTAPTRVESYARCSKCSLLRLCLHEDGVPVCRFCREHTQADRCTGADCEQCRELREAKAEWTRNMERIAATMSRVTGENE